MSTPIYDSVAKPVTTDAKGEPTLIPAPKVQWAAYGGAAAAVLVAMLAAVTPDMLSFAGQFTPVIFAGVGALAAVIAAYAKRP